MLENETYRIIEFVNMWTYSWGWKLQKKVFGVWITIETHDQEDSSARSWANVTAGRYQCDVYTLEGHKETWQKKEYK